MSGPQSHAWITSTPKQFGPDAGVGATGLRSVGHALDVLECFATDGELGVSDIARRVGIAKSTAHRLLQTLTSRGYVEQNPRNGQYRLGLHLYELGQLAQARNAFRHVALPHMRSIAQATGHTVNFGVPDGADVVFIERIEVGSASALLDHVGRRMPLHCTSAGKVLAAFNPEVDQARREAGFPPRTRRTVRSAADWDKVLDDVRRKGFAVSQNESFDNVTTLAVPVLRRRRAVAAISALDITETITPDLTRLHALLAQAAREISADLDKSTKPTT